jgi:hypothetical protein
MRKGTFLVLNWRQFSVRTVLGLTSRSAFLASGSCRIGPEDELAAAVSQVLELRVVVELIRHRRDGERAQIRIALQRQNDVEEDIFGNVGSLLQHNKMRLKSARL